MRQQFTDKERKELLRTVRIDERGELGIIEELNELDEKIDKTAEKLIEDVREVENLAEKALKIAQETSKPEGKPGYTPIKGVDYFDGSDGKDAEITPALINEIAKKVKIPIVEKVVEKTETIREIPVVRETISTDTGEAIVDKINSLSTKEENQIDASHIKNLPQIIKETRPFIGGRVGLQIYDDNTKVGTKTNEINFGTGLTVAETNGRITVTGGGGSGTPGGSDTQVQFNDSSSFGGDAGLTFDKTNDVLTVGVGTGRVVTHALKSDHSDGILLEANNGTDVGIFGAGNTNNSLFYGGVNILGTTTTKNTYGNSFSSILPGTVTRSGNYISSIALTGGNTITVTRSGNYISSITDGNYTWTFTRDGNNRISSWSVA